jgi:hypothetical protein
MWVRPSQDLWSPDTRDAALISQGPMQQPTTTITVDRAPGPAAVRAPSNGFDWLDVAVGAAGALGLALIVTAGRSPSAAARAALSRPSPDPPRCKVT